MEYAKLIGTPYNVLDCWGVVKEFYKLVFDIELKRYYDDIPNNRSIARDLVYTNMGDFAVVTEKPKFGDIMLIRLAGIESHIAVYLGGGKMLHTQKTMGCHIDSVKRWEKLIVNYYRVKND